MFVASVVGLGVGARLLVDAAVALARRVGFSDLVVGLTVVAAGTSTPELVVTADAAMAGLGDVAVGNVAGSNVYNLAFILGVVAAIRVIPIERSLVHRDGVVLVASTFVFAGVLLDGAVARLEGGLLVVAYVAYTAYLLWDARSDAAATDSGGAATAGSGGGATTGSVDATGAAVPLRVAAPSASVRSVVLLVVGLAVVLASGHVLVESATVVASAAGLSDALIGGTIVAAGTSTPEFAVSLVALSRGSVGVSVGNVVGSNVFNALAVLGVGALVRPLAVSSVVLETVAWLVVVVLVAVALMWSGRRLSRPEGVLFALSEVGRWTAGILGIVG
nr:calcium/sodium antiporter [Halorubellus sp. JP-L1]